MGVKVQYRKDRGAYYVYIRHKKRRKNLRVGPNEEDAQYVAHGIRTALASGNYNFDDEPETGKPLISLKEYHEKDQKHLAASVSESTVQGYADNFRLHVGPALATVPLNEIDRIKVKDFVASLVAKGLKRTSIRKITAELCAMLNRAIEDGYIKSNPASRMSKYYKHAKEREEPILPFSPDEVPTFLQAVKKYHAYYLPVFVTFLHSGMRAGEVAALRWSEVDYVNRWLTVRSSVSRGKVGKTKTGKIRKVDMSDLLIATLKDWQARQKKKYSELPEWVFTNHEGGRLDMKNLYHRPFIGSLKKAEWKDGEGRQHIGLKHRRLHDLRHTFATLLIMQGESLAYVKDQLGHASIKLTVDTYSHWIPGSNRQAVNKLPGIKSATKKVLQFRKAQ